MLCVTFFYLWNRENGKNMKKKSLINLCYVHASFQVRETLLYIINPLLLIRIFITTNNIYNL